MVIIQFLLLFNNDSCSFKEFSNSLISIPLFLSNFQFWSESGYFATAAEKSLFLHTWSLAVEEQYYLFFPLLILFLEIRIKEPNTFNRFNFFF